MQSRAVTIVIAAVVAVLFGFAGAASRCHTAAQPAAGLEGEPAAELLQP